MPTLMYKGNTVGGLGGAIAGVNIPSVYTSLADLPDASNLSSGARAIVRATAYPFEIMEFEVDARAAGSRRWRCIGGASDNLVNVSHNFTVQWAREPITGNPNWDFRFPYQLIAFGSTSTSDSTHNVDSRWFRFSSEDIEALTETADNATTGQTVVVRFIEAGTDVRHYELARGAGNKILVASSDVNRNINKLRIRGAA